MRVKTQEKRQEILTVARDVFRERGYAGTSMSEISARVGGSKSTIYGYFGSKEELFIAVMIEVTRQSVGPLVEKVERAQDLKSVLPSFIHEAMRLLTSAEVVRYRRMIIGEAERYGIGKLAFEQGPHTYLPKLAELLDAHMQRGHFRRDDPWQAALLLQSLCMGGLAQLVLEGVIERVTDGQVAAAARAAAEVFLKGYLIDRGPENSA